MGGRFLMLDTTYFIYSVLSLPIIDQNTNRIFEVTSAKNTLL